MQTRRVGLQSLHEQGEITSHPNFYADAGDIGVVVGQSDCDLTVCGTEKHEFERSLSALKDFNKNLFKRLTGAREQVQLLAELLDEGF